MVLTYAFTDRYPLDLTSAYRHTRVWDPSWALSKDPDAYEKILREPTISAAIQARKHAIAPRTWSVVSGGDDGDHVSEEAAKVVEAILKRIDRFAEARFNLADAVMRGRSYGYTRGRFQIDRFGKDRKHRNWWVPYAISDVDARRFRRVVVDHKTLATRWELWDVAAGRWCVPECPEAFVKHVYDDDEANLGYGKGLTDALYLYWKAKTILIEKGLQGAARWADGWILVKIEGLREGSTGKTNEAIQTAFLDAAKNQQGGNTLAFDKNDEVEAMNGGGEGHQIVMGMLRYLDDSITRLLTGSLLPTGGGEPGAGSLARAEVEQDSSDAIYQYDRAILDDTLTRDLIGLVWDLNRETFVELGLCEASMPRFKTVQDSKHDPLISAQVAEIMLRSGVRIAAKDLYDRTGFKVPKAGDDVIEPKATPAPMLPPGFGAEERFSARVDRFEAKLAEIATPAVIAPPAPVMSAPIVNVSLSIPPDAVRVVAEVRSPDVHVAAPVVNVAPADVRVDVAPADVRVTSPDVVVNVPTQAAPIVNVAAPSVVVSAPPPVVVPAPVVNVTIPKPVARVVTVERDAAGDIVRAESRPKDES